MIKVSIICPVYNEENYIEQCVQTLLHQDVALNDIEIIFVDGRSSDKTREIIEEYSKEYPFIKLLDNPKRTVPFALNKAINHAKGKYIIRIDAHCKYPTNYISTLIKYAKKLDCDNIGAICRTLPADCKTKSLAIAIGMSHRFGVGNSYFRIGSQGIKKVDTVPFGCFKKSIFSKIGLFDLELTRNQDDEFNGRIINNGGSIYLVSDLIVDYYARNSLSKLFNMFYQYGLFKPLVNKKLGSPATLRQFVPLLFVLGLFLGGILSAMFSCIALIYFTVLALYGLLLTFYSTKEFFKHRKSLLFFYLPLVFIFIHTSYGLGYIKGIYKLIFNKSFQVQANR